MKITERDIEVIRFINEFGFCDIKQLQVRFEIRKTWMYEIMKRLVYAGLIYHKYILHAKPGVYFVSKKGAKHTDLPAMERIYIEQYEHQISIIKVYIKLRQQYPTAHWVCERQLKQDEFQNGFRKRRHIADGLLIFPEDKQIAIEVELSPKGKSRLEKILKGYASQFSINEVWYFCAPKGHTGLKNIG